MTRFDINVYSHGFSVRLFYESDITLMLDFCKRFTSSKKIFDRRQRRHVTVRDRAYVITKEDHYEFGFLLSDLESLQSHLNFNSVPVDHVIITRHTPSPGDDITVNINEGWTPRDKQKAAIEAIQKKDANTTLHAATGFGKSYCSCWSVAHHSKRTLFTMVPTHIKTLVDALQDITDIKKEEIVVVKGLYQLQALIEMRQVGIMKYKAIFISLVTLREYIKEWESGYPTIEISPIELLSFLGIGLMIRDEVHEHLHAVIRQQIVSHVPHIINMSATLISKDPFIRRQFNRAFPEEQMFISQKNKHIIVHPYNHHMDYKTKVKHKGSRGYSHIKYEASILKSKSITKRYMRIIREAVSSTFLEDYKEGLKCLVLASTTDMCHAIERYIRQYLDENDIALTTDVFVSGCNTECLYDRDIVVSTPGSAGTGKDIPNLSHVIQTIALGSEGLSEQIMGRLRPIKLYPEMDPRYIYINNLGIPRHIHYDKERRFNVRQRCKDIIPITTALEL